MKNKVLTAVLSTLALLSFTGLALAAKPTKYKCSKSSCGLIETYSSYKGTNIKCPKCGSAMTEVKE
jgi:Zn finger protein HypA/HybF involved in hydrogenase expression